MNATQTRALKALCSAAQDLNVALDALHTETEVALKMLSTGALVANSHAIEDLAADVHRRICRTASCRKVAAAAGCAQEDLEWAVTVTGEVDYEEAIESYLSR